METIKQAIKYGVVGLSNTLITMIVIWVMMKLFGCREGLSNLTGGSVHDRFHYLLCLTVRIGTDLEFPTYDRSLLQPLDWNGFLYGD